MTVLNSKRWTALFLALAVIVSHQLTKIIVFSAVNAHGGPIEVLPFFNLVEVWNTGISFGMFNQLPYGRWLLSALAMVIVLFLLRWLWLEESKITAAALGLIIGGAIGNVMDRLRLGAGADYLDFHALGYHWPAFNVTDSAIFLGVLVLICPPKNCTSGSETIGYNSRRRIVSWQAGESATQKSRSFAS